MKKIYLYFICTTLYCLLASMYCEEPDEPEFVSVNKLTAIELNHFDFSGITLEPVTEKTSKEAYVIGVKCFVDVYEVPSVNPWADGKLLEADVLHKGDVNILNIESYYDIITLYDFDDEHKAGSSVRDCFSKKSLNVDNNQSYALVLRKLPVSGVHSFKLIYNIKEKEIESESENDVLKQTIESTTTPIELL